MLIKNTNALILRIRMPVSSDKSIRNFITKITTYEKICSIPNSMTILDELLPISVEMMKNQETGCFNFTNPGVISHNEILEMYKEIVDPTFTWKNMTILEQDKLLLSKRSNNSLDTTKLESKYKVDNIRDGVRKCLVCIR
jgi:3,5-epimerase/4-reductase